MPALNFLLEQACPSIQYRLRREILGENPFAAHMQELQARVLLDPEVQRVAASQQPDGWLGWNFHGENGVEAGVRLLREKGLEPSHLLLARALDALQAHPERLARGIGKPGPWLDVLNLGGTQMIRAAVFAYAGAEERPGVQGQIEAALNGMDGVLAVQSTAELVETRRGKTVLRAGVVWPSIYHLRLLAWTYSWRTANNLLRVQHAVERLVKLSPIPAFNVITHGQLVAPASFAMQDFNSRLADLSEVGWMLWFHRVELLARLGMIRRVPALMRQVNELAAMLTEGNGFFTRRLSHPCFHAPDTYGGLRLETDWRASQRRVNDLTFRCILVNFYSSAIQPIPG